jgi:hypothetical protein
MQASPQFEFDRLQFRLPPLTHRLAQHRKPAPSRLRAAVREAQIGPALSPGRVALGRVSLGPFPSLPRLHGRFLDRVRRLRRYYEAVRLPLRVHHRRTSSDFPMRLPRARQTPRGSPGSRAKCFRTCLRSLTAQGPSVSRHFETTSVAFRLRTRRRRPGGPARRQGSHFAAQWLRLYVPLSTLHVCPRGHPCMTRGRRGWRGLQRVTLSFTTFRRFVPAHARWCNPRVAPRRARRPSRKGATTENIGNI